MRRSDECKIRIKMYESWGNKLGEMNKRRFEKVLKKIEKGDIENAELSEEQSEALTKMAEKYK